MEKNSNQDDKTNNIKKVTKINFKGNSLSRTKSLSRLNLSNDKGTYLLNFKSNRRMHNYGKRNEIDFKQVSTKLSKKKYSLPRIISKTKKQKSHKQLKTIKASKQMKRLKKVISDKCILVNDKEKDDEGPLMIEEKLINNSKIELSGIQSKKFKRMLKKFDSRGSMDKERKEMQKEINQKIENIGKSNENIEITPEVGKQLDEYGMKKIKRESLKQNLNSKKVDKKNSKKKSNLYTKAYNQNQKLNYSNSKEKNKNDRIKRIKNKLKKNLAMSKYFNLIMNRNCIE
jgi:hypothetical protein